MGNPFLLISEEKILEALSKSCPKQTLRKDILKFLSVFPVETFDHKGILYTKYLKDGLFVHEMIVAKFFFDKDKLVEIQVKKELHGV